MEITSMNVNSYSGICVNQIRYSTYIANRDVEVYYPT